MFKIEGIFFFGRKYLNNQNFKKWSYFFKKKANNTFFNKYVIKCAIKKPTTNSTLKIELLIIHYNKKVEYNQ